MVPSPWLRLVFVAAPLGVLATSTANAQPAPQQQPQQPRPASPPNPAPPAGGTAGTTGQGNGAPEAAANLRESQEHLLRATDLFGRRLYRESIQEFELAYRASASADLWYNIARCHELIAQDASLPAIRQQEYELAVEHYRRYLRDKVDPPDRASVERHIQELTRAAEQARVAARRQDASSHVRFDVNPPGARVFFDEREVGRAPMARSLDVVAGTHPVRVTAPGMQEWRASVRVRQGESVIAYARLTPETRYRTVSGRHIASFILGGLGIAGLGVGAGFGIAAATMDTMHMEPPMSGCDGAMNNLVCQRHGLATTADVMFAVGAGLLLSAVIVYFVEAGSSRTERVTAPPSRRAAPR